MIRRLIPGVLPGLLAVALSTSGCKAPQAFGDRHSLIVRADSTLWPLVDTTFRDAIERPVFTTRPEREFNVTFVAATDTAWRNLRLWQQVVVLGTGEDEVARRVLRASDDPDARPPAVVQAPDIWARGQVVSLLLLPEGGGADAVGALASELYPLLADQYTEWSIQRMYVTGVNDSLVDALSAYGFTLEVPEVYGFYQEDSAFRFRNAYPDPGTRLRSVLVTWKTGLDAVDAESLRAWREEIDEVRYDPPQDVLDANLRFDSITVGDVQGVELRGVWQDRSDYPAAGPFIARALSCPESDRTYYIDAWLYAPGTDKYPYLRQLEILLSSFRCTEVSPPPQAARGVAAAPLAGGGAG